MAKTVALFCGHGISTDGSWDSGCVYNGYQEAKLVMPIVKSATYYLRKSGVKVITDYAKNDINMIKQVEKANSKNADAFVSVHLDYYKADPGVYPLYLSSGGQKLGSKMSKSIRYYSSIKNRGLAKRPDLYELSATNMPACVLEVGCIKKDLRSVVYEYDFIGFGIAKGICEFLGVKFKPLQYEILKQAARLEGPVKRNLRYSGKATNITFTKALKGNKLVNCALYVSWILQRARALPFNKRIWLGNTVHGSGTNVIKKKCTILHPKKLPRKCKFHVADLVGYQWGSSKRNLVHTMIILRFDNHRPVFATCGGSDLKAKDLSRKRATYEKKPVKTICRWK